MTNLPHISYRDDFHRLEIGRLVVYFLKGRPIAYINPSDKQLIVNHNEPTGRIYTYFGIISANFLHQLAQSEFEQRLSALFHWNK